LYDGAVLDLRDRTSGFILASDDADGKSLFVPEWGVAEWNALFALTSEIELPAGTTLMRQGESGRTLYFVVAGAIKVSVVYGDQILGLLREVGPGSVVGEVAFFDNGPRTAKVWATEDSMLLRLNYEDYQKFAAANPQRAAELLLALGALVSRRFRDVMMRARV
jgi:CRP-like cAMP-binding protein